MNALLEAPDTLAPDLQSVIEVFDDELRSDLPFVNDLTERIAAYRGKLLRPRLLLLAGQATGGLRREHTVLAAVVEMVHMATLVHDDVLDEADLRRRGPTINRLSGNEAAVMLGDYLISHAYHLCSSLGSTAWSRRIAGVTNVVCEGELMQIAHRGDFALSEQTYMEIIRRKTGALTGVCCELGAAVCRPSEDTIRRMALFGEELGIAFQIVDDLLDLTGSTEELGKSVGRDAEMCKPTLPIIRLLAQAAPDDRRRMIERLRCGAGSREAARDLLAGSEALDYAIQAARRYISSATRRLDALPPSAAKDALRAAAEFVLERRR